MTISEGTEFPFQYLTGELPPVGTVGTLTIHRDGQWTFETIEGLEAIAYFIVYDGGTPVVSWEFLGEIPVE